MQTFYQFFKETSEQCGNSFLLSPSGVFTWDSEHWNAAVRIFKDLKGKSYNFNMMMTPAGKDKQDIPFEKFLQDRGYTWGHIEWNSKIIKLFPVPRPTERQIKAVEDFALESALKTDIESATLRKLKYIVEEVINK